MRVSPLIHARSARGVPSRELSYDINTSPLLRSSDRTYLIGAFYTKKATLKPDVGLIHVLRLYEHHEYGVLLDLSSFQASICIKIRTQSNQAPSVSWPDMRGHSGCQHACSNTKSSISPGLGDMFEVPANVDIHLRMLLMPPATQHGNLSAVRLGMRYVGTSQPFPYCNL